MKQKDIYWAHLEPIRGREQGGRRPVVIISGDTMNRCLDMAIVCPLSSRIKGYENDVVLIKDRLNRLKCDSEVITFQVRAISKERLIKKIGVISDEALREIFKGLIDVLTY